MSFEPRELGTLIVVVVKAVSAATPRVKSQRRRGRGLSTHTRTDTQPSCLENELLSSHPQRNLPNLARFGKQHPFCTVMVGSIKHKTKVIQR
jgi:hypothetical protein